jgi:hypothetical protein
LDIAQEVSSDPLIVAFQTPEHTLKLRPAFHELEPVALWREQVAGPLLKAECIHRTPTPDRGIAPVELVDRIPKPRILRRVQQAVPVARENHCSLCGAGGGYRSGFVR